MRIHYFQHVPFEGLAMIEAWAVSNNYSLSSTEFYKSDYVLPAVDQYDILIVMGGPMSVNDSHPWLDDERECIRQAIDSNKYVLGICLGAQLIAQVLGAEVTSNSQTEIGWYPIAFSDEALGHPVLSGLNHAMAVLHWHGEKFSIPDDALPIASSAACINQGFIYREKVLALQFHLEMDVEAVKKIIAACRDELVEGEFIQSEEVILQGTERHHLQRVLFRLLDNWLGLADVKSPALK